MDVEHLFRTESRETLRAMYEKLAHDKWKMNDDVLFARMNGVRRGFSSFLSGVGVEVGAGDRVFEVPENCQVIYGDVRDSDELKLYFGAGTVFGGGTQIDAQTFRGFDDGSIDFVISSHVIEHLWDPIGAIKSSMRVLRQNGVFLLVVPDMRHTFDHMRPETTLEHALVDYADGGMSTRWQAYEERLRFISPALGHPVPTDSEIPRLIDQMISDSADTHVHAWSETGIMNLISHCATMFCFTVEAHCFSVNENLFCLRKNGSR